MIDIATEKLLSLPEAAKLIPSCRNGRPTHPATIWRLINRGQLEGVYLGTRWATSLEAIQRYLNAQTEAALRGQCVSSASGRTICGRRNGRKSWRGLQPSAKRSGSKSRKRPVAANPGAAATGGSKVCTLIIFLPPPKIKSCRLNSRSRSPAIR